MAINYGPVLDDYLTGKTIFQGGPSTPKFNVLRTEEGLMPEQLRLNLDRRALDKLREQSLAEGEISPWAAIEQEKQKLAEAHARDKLMRRNAGLRRQVEKLGRGGTSELANLKAMQQRQRSLSDMARQAGQDKLNILQKMEQQRMSNLMKQPGRELQAMAPEQFNIQNALREKRAEDVARQQSWNEAMKAYAASQTSRALLEADQAGFK